MRSPASVAALALALLAPAFPAAAQQSASYHVSGSVLNEGGHPQQGVIVASASYRVSLGAIGEEIADGTLAAAGYHVDAGFTTAYPPPTEVLGLLFTSAATLRWNPERSVGAYDLYRGDLGTFPGTAGACLQSAVTGETWDDPAAPVTSAGWFYLVTAVNRIGEEGTKGTASDGTERDRSLPCP